MPVDKNQSVGGGVEPKLKTAGRIHGNFPSESGEYQTHQDAMHLSNDRAELSANDPRPRNKDGNGC